MTGNSEGQIVIDSMKAGATDFVVKPLDRTTLIAKMFMYWHDEALIIGTYVNDDRFWQAWTSIRELNMTN